MSAKDGWPIVFGKRYNDQLWKHDTDDDSSSPLWRKLKNYDRSLFLCEEDEKPRASLENFDSKKTRYLWKLVPDGDTKRGQNIASLQAAVDEQAVALQKLKEENAPSADQAAAKADLKASEAALREAEQSEEVDLTELESFKKSYTENTEKSVVQLLDYAKETANAALDFDKLTATMIFVGAFYLSIIHQFTPYLNTRLPTCSSTGVDALQLGRVIDSSNAHAKKGG